MSRPHLRFQQQLIHVPPQDIIEDNQPIDPIKVDKLAASIREVDILQPLVAYRDSQARLRIVAGRHRRAAAMKLGRCSVPVRIILELDSPQWLAVAASDENTIRGQLSPAELAATIAERDALLVHSGKANQAQRDAYSARELGVNPRTVRRTRSRHAALGDELIRLTGTSLDKGLEIDALVKLPEQRRKTLIERAINGERVSAREDLKAWADSIATSVKPTPLDEAKTAMLALSDQDRLRFLEWCRDKWGRPQPTAYTELHDDQGPYIHYIYMPHAEGLANV